MCTARRLGQISWLKLTQHKRFRHVINQCRCFGGVHFLGTPTNELTYSLSNFLLKWAISYFSIRKPYFLNTPLKKHVSFAHSLNYLFAIGSF